MDLNYIFFSEPVLTWGITKLECIAMPHWIKFTCLTCCFGHILEEYLVRWFIICIKRNVISFTCGILVLSLDSTYWYCQNFDLHSHEPLCWQIFELKKTTSKAKVPQIQTVVRMFSFLRFSFEKVLLQHIFLRRSWIS